MWKPSSPLSPAHEQGSKSQTLQWSSLVTTGQTGVFTGQLPEVEGYNCEYEWGVGVAEEHSFDDKTLNASTIASYSNNNKGMFQI